MKKILLFAVFLIISFPLLSKTILGIEEGVSKSQALVTLYKMYGVSNITDNSSSIEILNPVFCGYTFNMVELFFIPLNGDNRFNSAVFQKWFDLSELNEAKEMRDNLLMVIKKKYGNQICVEFENDQGFKSCEFGLRTETHTTGTLKLRQLKGIDGKERFYIFLEYFPFDYNHINDEL